MFYTNQVEYKFENYTYLAALARLIKKVWQYRSFKYFKNNLVAILRSSYKQADPFIDLSYLS